MEDDRFHCRGSEWKVSLLALLVIPDVNVPFEIMSNTQNFGFELHFPVSRAERIFKIFFTKFLGKDLNNSTVFLSNRYC